LFSFRCWAATRRCHIGSKWSWAPFIANCRRSWRFGARYGEFKELAEAGEQWSPEQNPTIPVKQLRIVLHHAANSCPFYQKAFARAGFRPENVRTLDDLKDCPWLEKKKICRPI